MRTRATARTIAGLILSLVATGAASGASAAVQQSAIAVATIRDGNGVIVGRAALVQQGATVIVGVQATGMTPGLHGLHIHTVGSCVGPSFTSAGAHFNPTNANHGAHAGDLPDLSVNQAGLGMMAAFTTHFTLLPGPLSIFDTDGAAIVVHANPDDHVTNPSGNSGPRLACGEINRIS
jgi:Cu-Zn family superoxide dismutase